MGAAEVIAFEEVRASQPWTTLRHQRHERFAQGLDTLATPWHALPSTLPAVTAAVWALRQQRTGGITETIVAHVPRREHARTQVHGAQCDGVWRARARVRRTGATMGGPVQRERPYVSCRSCRVGRDPCDEALEGGAGCTQRDRQKAAAPWVTAGPYDTAPSLFDNVPGVSCGSERRPTIPHQVAAGLTVGEVAPPREEITRRVAAVAAGRWRRPVVGLGSEGA